MAVQRRALISCRGTGLRDKPRPHKVLALPEGGSVAGKVSALFRGVQAVENPVSMGKPAKSGHYVPVLLGVAEEVVKDFPVF